ncbi:MAG: hypothetical protein AB8G15_21805 [Saprospiraceae bacterium]
MEVKKIIRFGIGVSLGSALYHYLANGIFDWKRTVLVALIAMVLFFIFGKMKKTK